MASLTANDLKTKGIAAIEAVLAERPEAIVTVRGKDRFVVMRTQGVSIEIPSTEFKASGLKQNPMPHRHPLQQPPLPSHNPPSPLTASAACRPR